MFKPLKKEWKNYYLILNAYIISLDSEYILLNPFFF